MPVLQPPAETSSSRWKEYWDTDPFWADSPLWKINAGLFFQNAVPLLKIQPTDVILDIGCGPGDVAQHFAPQAKKVIAADPSHRMIELARRNCAPFSNIAVEPLSDNLESLISSEQPSLMLCVSVVQYFESLTAIESWIQTIRSVAPHGSRLFIADLPLQRNFFGSAYDRLCSVMQSIRKGYFLDYFETSIKLLDRQNPYYQVASKNAAIAFTVPWMGEIVRHLNLNATVHKESLSICANRPSLLIQF